MLSWESTLFTALVAFLASFSTLFSGFGLGTILLPAFALFFPAQIAVALTALVHFLNNLFKFALLGRYANWRAVAWFGGPAIVAAFGGAWLLGKVARMPPIWQYTFGKWEFQILPVNLLIGLLILTFAIVEWREPFQQWQISSRWLPVGGLLSGFFGGLSGHQGALRSAFLLRAGLQKEAFIATGVVISLLVDVTRIGVYLDLILLQTLQQNFASLVLVVLAAFSGAFLGARLLKKVTYRVVRYVVATFLMGIGLGMCLGWV